MLCVIYGVTDSNELNVSQVYFESEDVYACIVTCGGLCPGVNTVIREIVCGLYHMYGVHKVLGIEVPITLSAFVISNRDILAVSFEIFHEHFHCVI